jgi:saccharopine dehydrogenase-like NADP-dependent oxidoreductase
LSLVNSLLTNRKILLLGSGFVAKPTLDYLARNPQNHITVACRTLSKAKSLIGNLKNATPQSIDVSSTKDLDDAVSQHDLIISLIPYTYHVDVIKSAIKFKRNVVTTSYVSDAMKELEPQ